MKAIWNGATLAESHDSTSLSATGHLEDDEPHSSERFARAVAARLGWEI